MSAKYWKLAITSLSSGSAGAREAVVEGDNWLSALRSARKVLGEDGAVPPGASCVMSSNGEVTILDSAQRLRYLLIRTEAPVPAVAPTPTSSLPPPAVKVAPAPKPRATTLAYSPEQSAAARAELNAALAARSTGGGNALPAAPENKQSQESPAPAAAPPAPQGVPPPPTAAPSEKPPESTKPAFAPARPQSKPPPEKTDASKVDPRRPIPAKRNATVAYSPEEAAQLRPSQDVNAVGVAATERPTAAASNVQPTATATTAATVRASEPAEPSAARVQAASGSTSADTPPAAPSPTASDSDKPLAPAALSAVDAPAGELPAPPASLPLRARKQTIAYSPEESAKARAQLVAATTASTTTTLTSSEQDHLVETEVPSMLVMLGQRDEEASKESPLTYRERSYYWPPPAARAEVERALRAELTSVRRALGGRPRGQYVNLALFDHAFGDKPERPPIATLQWKDWRGEPVFAWLDEPANVAWIAPAQGQPVASSHVPEPSEAKIAPTPLPPPAALPSLVSAPVPMVAAPAPMAAAPTPMRAPTRRESTGEQDLRLTVAFEAVQDLYFLATPADGLDFAVRLLGELIPSEAISGCIYDINTDEFRFVAVTGEGASERRAAAVSSTQGLFGIAAHSGLDSLIVPDVMNEPRFEEDVDGRGGGLIVRNVAYFVLHKADQLLGMLQLINREGGQAFRESDIAVASYVANQVTAFLREKRGLTRSHG